MDRNICNLLVLPEKKGLTQLSIRPTKLLDYEVFSF